MKSPSVLTGLFIEYGNSEDVKLSDTRPLPASNSRPRGDNSKPRGDKPQYAQSDRGHNSSRENNYNNPRINQQRADNSQHEYSQQPQYQQYNNQRQYGGGHFPNHQVCRTRPAGIAFFHPASARLDIDIGNIRRDLNHTKL